MFDQNIFVVGDFNVRPINSFIQTMDEFFVYTFEKDMLSAYTYHDYHGGSRRPKYDYIYY